MPYLSETVKLLKVIAAEHADVVESKEIAFDLAIIEGHAPNWPLTEDEWFLRGPKSNDLLDLYCRVASRRYALPRSRVLR